MVGGGQHVRVSAGILLPKNRGFLSTTSLISPTSSMLVYLTAMWTPSGSSTTCCSTSDRVGLLSLKERRSGYTAAAGEDRRAPRHTHGSTLLEMEAMMKSTASVTSQGGFPSFSVE